MRLCQKETNRYRLVAFFSFFFSGRTMSLAVSRSIYFSPANAGSKAPTVDKGGDVNAFPLQIVPNIIFLHHDTGPTARSDSTKRRQPCPSFASLSLFFLLSRVEIFLLRLRVLVWIFDVSFLLSHRTADDFFPFQSYSVI